MQMVITSEKGLTLHTDLKTTQQGEHVSTLDSAGYHGKHGLEKWETSQAFPKEKILLILSKSPWKQQAYKSEKGALGTPPGARGTISITVPISCAVRDGQQMTEVHVSTVRWLLSPLLPAEVIVAPKDQEEAQDSREDDGVPRENEGASSPRNLRQEEGHSQQVCRAKAAGSQSMLCALVNHRGK